MLIGNRITKAFIFAGEGGGGSVISTLDFYCMKLRMPTPTCTHLRERVGVGMTALKNHFGDLLEKHKAFNFYSVMSLDTAKYLIVKGIKS